MPETKTQRILALGAVLAFLVYYLISSWKDLHNGLFKFSPLDVALLVLGVIAIPIGLYRPIHLQPWVRLVTWGAAAIAVLYLAVSEWRHPVSRQVDTCVLLLVVATVVWGYQVLPIHRWLLRLFHRGDAGGDRSA